MKNLSNNNIENEVKNVFNSLAKELKEKKEKKLSGRERFNQYFEKKEVEVKTFPKNKGFEAKPNNNLFEKRTFNEKKDINTENNTNFGFTNKNTNTIKSKKRYNELIVALKSFFQLVWKGLKALFIFLKKRPILAFTLIIIFTLLINIKVINQTILLKNIDGIKNEIAVLKETQIEKNKIAQEKINKLKAEIARIETENKKFNEATDLKVRKKTEELKLKINKLTALNN